MSDAGFGKGFRLLIVDDEAVVRQVLGLVLEPTGFAIDQAADLAQARALVAGTTYDLVLTDKNLPDGSGLELASELHARKADCRVILITGYGSYESAVGAVQVGIADYLAKPFANLEDVRERIRRVVGELVAAREARSRDERAASVPASESGRRLRFSVDLPLRFVLEDGSQTAPAFVSHLSTSDLFVETDNPLPPGAKVRMQLFLPECAIEIDGIVRRHGEGRRMMGMRIDIVAPGEEAVGALSRYLAPRRRALLESGRIAPTVAELESFGADVSGRAPAALPEPPSPAEGGRGADATDAAPGSDQPKVPPNAAELFQAMHRQQGKVIQFLRIAAAPPVGSAGTFESLPPERFHPGNQDVVADSSTGKVSAPAEVAAVERFEAELRTEFALDESIFEGLQPEDAAGPAKDPVAERPATPTDAPVELTAEQRRACAERLKAQSDDALARGLLMRAASDLSLAMAFAPEDDALRQRHEELRGKANAVRAEDLYQQGLQQLALGEPVVASKMLLSACQLAYEKRYVLACAKVLLQLGTAEGFKELDTLIRAAQERDPDKPQYPWILGQVAELQGLPASVAVREYRRVLELDPTNEKARARLERLTGPA